MSLFCNLLTCPALLFTFPTFAEAIFLCERDSYIGSYHKDFKPRITCYPEGTDYILLDNVCFLDVQPSGEDSGVFTNQAGDLFFMGNHHSLTFANLMTHGLGAAISNRVGDTILTLASFSFLKFILSPLPDQGLGTIYSLGSVVIRDNSIVNFCSNSSSSNGAAIYTPYLLGSKARCPSVTLSRNKHMTFKDNVCQGYGGAIYTHHLNITTQGPTSFENNHAYHEVNTNGGAIAIAPGGSISLSVNNDHLFFLGNTVSKNGHITRNSIHLQSGACFSQLRAVSSSCIYFYDPVTCSESHRITDLVMNAPEGEQTYEGTIYFSGLCLDDEEICQENLTSTLMQDVILAAGTLFLSDSATLQLHSFKQEANSMLMMTPGTTLACSRNAQIRNLDIFIEDIENFIPVRISTEESDAIISLDQLKVTFESYWSTYDFPRFKKAFTLPLLELLGYSFDSLILEETTLDNAQIIIENKNVRGSWSFTWEETIPSLDKNKRITPTKKTIFLTWSP